MRGFVAGAQQLAEGADWFVPGDAIKTVDQQDSMEDTALYAMEEYDD